MLLYVLPQADCDRVLRLRAWPENGDVARALLVLQKLN